VKTIPQLGAEIWRENNSQSGWMGHLYRIILFCSCKSINRMSIMLGQNNDETEQKIDETEQNIEQIDVCFVRMMMIFRPTYTF
jgi:hypothetical protein